jgi:hypothetical protein
VSVVKRFGPGLVVAVLIAVGLGLAVNRWAPSDQPQPANLPLPSVDEIVSAHVNLYPIQTSYPAPLDPTNPRDRDVLSGLLGLLQRSTKASGKTDHSLEHNTSLTLTLNGRRTDPSWTSDGLHGVHERLVVHARCERCRRLARDER